MELSDVTQLRISRDYLSLSRCIESNYKSPYERQKNASSVRRRDNESPGSESERFEDVTRLALKIEEGAISQGIQVPLETGKGKETHSPPEPLEEAFPADTCFVSVKSISELRCIKPPGVW